MVTQFLSNIQFISVNEQQAIKLHRKKKKNP